MKTGLKVLIALILITVLFTACVSRKTDNLPPTVPTNIFPGDFVQLDINNFYAKWTDSTDPEGRKVKYRINYARTIDGLDDPLFYEREVPYFLFPNLEEGGWFWRLKVTDDAGNEVLSPVWSFIINGETLPQPVNPRDRPADPSLFVTNIDVTSFSLKWIPYKDVQNPANKINYKVDVYREGQNTAHRESESWFFNRSEPATGVYTQATSHTFNGLDPETTYNWTIIAQNRASQTNIVGNSSVRTGNHIPTAPKLLNPSDEAPGVATDVTFSWDESTDHDSGDEIRYYFYLDTLKNTNRCLTVDGIEETDYTPEEGILETGNSYYWFILVKDSHEAATKTETREFKTVSDGMPYPENPTPSDEATSIETKGTKLSWDFEEEGNYHYTISFGKEPGNLETFETDEKSYSPEEFLDENTWYYWKVNVTDTDTEKSVTGREWQFKTKGLEPPEQLEAKTNQEGTQIELTYDKDMKNPTGKHQQYTVKRDGEKVPTSRIELKPGTAKEYLFTLDEALNDGEDITISYEMGNVQSVEGGYLQDYSERKVENLVPGELPKCVEATITTDGREIELGFDKPMNAPTGTEYEQFGVLVNGFVNEIENASLKKESGEANNRVFVLQLEKLVGKNNNVYISYTKGTISAENGGLLESFQNRRVDTSLLKSLCVIKDIGWNYSTIQDAIDDVDEYNGKMTVITVATGTYYEKIDLGDKSIHLQSSDSDIPSVRDNTIIDASNNRGYPTVAIGELVASSERTATPLVILEGFTIRNAIGNNPVSSPRTGINDESVSGIFVMRGAEIRNNKISGNGTDTSGKGGRGIIVHTADEVLIHDNEISNNHNDSNGAGLLVLSGSPEIYNNTIKDNSAVQGSGIYVADPNAIVKNASGDQWRAFNAPNASIETVENTDLDNNTYSGNGTEEGDDIYFAVDKATTQGTLTLSPATATGDDPFTITLRYQLSGFFSNGTATFHLPSQIDSDIATITKDGVEETVEVPQMGANQIYIEDIDGDSREFILELRQTSSLDAGDYTFSAQSDRDGADSHYYASQGVGEEKKVLTIPPQYNVPQIELTEPEDGSIFETTSIEFTWEATAGSQSNNIWQREPEGFSHFLFYLATSTENFGEGIEIDIGTESTTVNVNFATDYKWKVEAVQNNGKTKAATSSFTTKYRLRDIGEEDSVYWIKKNGIPFYTNNVKIDKAKLPEKIEGYSTYKITVNGEAYQFRENEFQSTMCLNDDIASDTSINVIKNSIFEGVKVE